jgi:hypothetical protein
MFDFLEQQYGAQLLWDWTKEWVQSEKECDDDERMPLENYLWLRAENYDEEFGLKHDDLSKRTA